jgi:hypothetical protein
MYLNLRLKILFIFKDIVTCLNYIYYLFYLFNKQTIVVQTDSGYTSHFISYAITINNN